MNFYIKLFFLINFYVKNVIVLMFLMGFSQEFTKKNVGYTQGNNECPRSIKYK